MKDVEFMNRHLPYDRAERVADEIYRLVSEMLTMELSDPRLQGVRITRVNMTRDLKIARVHFHINDVSDEVKQTVINGFVSARGFLKRKIGTNLALKYTPEMEFFYDDSIDLRDKIESLFDERGVDEQGS